METIVLDGRHLTLPQLERVARGEARAALDPGAREAVASCRQALERLLERDEPLYGANTGFGLLSDVRVSRQDAVRLQENLIRSHCAGVGEPLKPEAARAMALLRANVLAHGHSAVRVEIIEALLGMLNAGLAPVIPSRGSVGASGDLAPLAQLALTLMGEGEVFRDGRKVPSAAALTEAGVAPVRLASREGLALVNGTQAMTAVGALALLEAERLAVQADVAGALTLEGLLGSARPFDERLAALRPHPGHAAAAANMRRLLRGSEIMDSHSSCGRVQDSYSLRCIPQVHGAARDALVYARRVLEIEINAVTDNPIFFPDEGTAVPGGNFHGQPVAQAMDLMAMAVCDLGSISERRTERLVNPALSGLPAFLAAQPGLESGFMMAQVTAAALVSECKVLAHPAGIDSIPTGAGKEDHVSMGVTAALKASQTVRHLGDILSIEILAAAQAVDRRRPLNTSPALEAVHAAVRRRVPPLDSDRVLTPDIEAVAALLRSGEIRRAAESVAGPLS
ncbi:MAG TPA: histidine ammonia-lyase [Candidatus Polarisedimenticolia bacterium]|nr:histidine ammonia-lyase [Candidatus Polarisedimenticolia bacterium]